MMHRFASVLAVTAIVVVVLCPPARTRAVDSAQIPATELLGHFPDRATRSSGGIGMRSNRNRSREFWERPWTVATPWPAPWACRLPSRFRPSRRRAGIST